MHQIVVTISCRLRPPFSPRAIGAFPVPENPHFLWEVMQFLKDILCESTVSPRGNRGQKVTRNGGAQIGAGLILAENFSRKTRLCRELVALLSPRQQLTIHKIGEMALAQEASSGLNALQLFMSLRRI